MHNSELPSAPEYVWFMEAARYLSGAHVLRQHPEYLYSRLLITPTNHLLAHGIELFLKGTLIRTGESEAGVRIMYGHDLFGLWNDERNVTTRSDVLLAAQEDLTEAVRSGVWADDFDSFRQPPIGEYLRSLSDAHSRQTNFALRYPAERPAEATVPKAHLLCGAFSRVADQYLRA
jgi:hypothetical protein